MLNDALTATLDAVKIFQAFNIPYFIGGSLATALHGVARATMDVDVIADLAVVHVQALSEELSGAFYVDDEMIQEAVLRQSSFNLIHRETFFKVDVFVRSTEPFDQAQFSRRKAYPLSPDAQETAYFATPEDNILAKLHWYRLGGEVSDRQWNDILNVIKVQADRLDYAYLRQWATKLNVENVFERALAQSAFT